MGRPHAGPGNRGSASRVAQMRLSPPSLWTDRQRVRSVCKDRRVRCDKPNTMLQREVAKAELFRRAERGEERRCKGQPRTVTALPPIEKFCGERPVLQGRGVAPVRQKDGQGRARRTAEFAVDLVKRRERQARSIDETIVGAELFREFEMRPKKCQRRGPVELILAAGRIGGQHTGRAGLFASGRFAVEYLLGAANDRAHQMLERHGEAGATGGPIEQEQGHGRRAERILALADRKAHLVSFDAEFLGKRLAQRNQPAHWRLPGAACVAAEARRRRS